MLIVLKRPTSCLRMQIYDLFFKQAIVLNIFFKKSLVLPIYIYIIYNFAFSISIHKVTFIHITICLTFAANPNRLAAFF